MAIYSNLYVKEKAIYNGPVDDSAKLYKIVSMIPAGKVTTYGQLAKISGVKSPRVVGNLLHKNPDPEKIPCHRVVNSKGFVAANFAFGGVTEQMKRLEKEGVTFTKGRVNPSKHFWHQ